MTGVEGHKANKGKLPQLPLPGEEAIVLNKDYLIMSVEEFTSDVQGFFGWRVILDGGSNNLLAIALWVRDIVGRKSKLGAFIETLGNDPDGWVGKIIRFVSWVAKERAIMEVK